MLSERKARMAQKEIDAANAKEEGGDDKKAGDATPEDAATTMEDVAVMPPLASPSPLEVAGDSGAGVIPDGSGRRGAAATPESYLRDMQALAPGGRGRSGAAAETPSLLPRSVTSRRFLS